MLVWDGLTVFGVLIAMGQQLGLLGGFFINALPVGIKTSVTAGTIFEGTRKPLVVWQDH